MKGVVVLVVVVLCVVCDVHSKKEVKPSDRDVLERGLVTEKVRYNSILKEHGRYAANTTVKHFQGTTLGYVTPWNNHGYDVAKIFASKLDIVSPVWFRITPTMTSTGRIEHVLVGEQDVDAGWLADVRASRGVEDSAPLILPRFALDGFRKEHLLQLVRFKESAWKLVKDIIDMCKKHSLDGIVLEIGYIGFRHPAEQRKDLIDFFNDLGKKLHLEGMTFVSVQPALDSLFDSTDLLALKNNVDFFSIMSYDHSGPRQGSNSPLPWAMQSLLRLIPPEKRSDLTFTSKVLLGLPFYGYKYLRGQGEPIIGSQYLDLVKEWKPVMHWDGINKEHIAKSPQGEEEEEQHMVVYYPTLKFIEERLKMADEIGVGISIWETGQGLDYFYDLL